MSLYRIVLVFDKNYGEKLLDLASNHYVWIIGSEINFKYARHYWETYPAEEYIDPETEIRGIQEDLDKGITVLEDISVPFDNELLDMLWDHHGIYAHDPPLSEILVIGLPLTDNVKHTINDYDLSTIAQGDGWFLVRDCACSLDDTDEYCILNNPSSEPNGYSKTLISPCLPPPTMLQLD